MAERYPDDIEEIEIFLAELLLCKDEIVRQFEELDKMLNERKQVLLGEIASIKERYEKSKETMRKINRIEESKISIHKSLIKVDNLLDSNTTQQDVLSPLEAEIRKLKTTQETFTNIQVSFSEETQLISLLGSYGIIYCSTEISYKERAIPHFTLFPSQIFQFTSLYGITIAADGSVYTADRFRGKIVVLSKDLKNIRLIENQRLKAPYGVCVNEDSLFVTDAIRHNLIKFKLDGNFVKQVGSFGSRNNEFQYPYSLDVNSDNLVFVCDNDNNRVSVFNSNLQWKNSIVNPGLTYPRDVKVKEEVFVLCGDKKIFIFSKSFKFVKILKSLCNFVKNPFWFCIDNNGNFLISDRDGSVIKVFSPEGKLDCILGEKVQENGYRHCHDTQGIAIYQNRDVISVSSDVNVSLKLF